MFGVLGIFFGSKGTSRWTVLVCLLIAGLAEGVGLATLLPLVELASANDASAADASSSLNRYILEFLSDLGLTPDLGSLVTIVVAGIFIKSALLILAMKHVGYTVAEVATRLRSRLIDTLLAAKWEYFTRLTVDTIANAVSIEASRAGHAYLLAALTVASFIQCIVYVIVAFLVSWRLAVAAVLIGCVITIVLNWLVHVAKRAERRQTKRTSELIADLSDALVGIKVLKAMARQGHFAAIMGGKIESLRRALRKQVISAHVLRNMREPLLVLCLGIGFYLAVSEWALPISKLLIMGLLLHSTVSTIGKIQQYYQKAMIVESAYWSIHRLIEQSIQEAEPVKSGLTPTLNEGCVIENVALSFGSNKVLENLSLEIPAGKLTVITGESGGGKSTLSDILLGLYQPDSGRILIDGIPFDRIDMNAWCRMVGYVPQEVVLFHDTVLANVRLGDESIAISEVKRALELAGAWPFVETMKDGIHGQVGERGLKVSGGQRQRIALARALVHQPRLLILDEVTSALDPETEMSVVRNVRALSNSLTILAVTHTRPGLVWLIVSTPWTTDMHGRLQTARHAHLFDNRMRLIAISNHGDVFRC